MIKKPTSPRSATAKSKPAAIISPPDTVDGPSTDKSVPSHIVGMGGSAGSLEAFQQFFEHSPPNSGMAYVIVTHLAADDKGMLAELLQKSTMMEFHPIVDGMQVLANNVYVVPPNKELSIKDGSLHLQEPTVAHSRRMPIDYFLQQLAVDQGDKAVCIILSGMATDGTIGARAIKASHGLVMVQDPETSKFDSMPRSALGTGVVDYTASAQELPSNLNSYISHKQIPPKLKAVKEDSSGSTFKKIIILLRSRTGIDFSAYKRTTIIRRIDRRLSAHKLNNLLQYLIYLQENPTEIDLLFSELLIGVTNFFRDSSAFEALAVKVLPTILQNKQSGSTLRVWVAGCSTGEEAYSIAILIHECFASLNRQVDINLQLFATDISESAIEIGRKGIYPANIAAEMPPNLLDRYFVLEGTNYRIRRDIREMVVFARHNVLSDPPFTKLDLITCRNLMIYFTSEAHKKVIPLFHHALLPDGFLLLGSAESIGGSNELFVSVDNKWKIYAKKLFHGKQLNESLHSQSHLTYGNEMITPMPTVPPVRRNILAAMAEKLLLESFSPPTVFITTLGDIVYIHGQTGKFLEIPTGKAHLNVYTMARLGLKVELGAAIHRVLKDQQPVTLRGLKVNTHGSFQTIDLTVSQIQDPAALRGLLMVAFQEIPNARVSKANPSAIPSSGSNVNQELANTKEELEDTKERLQAVIEQMETSQEQLSSANEELQSTTEEMQSSSEELITSREELQSTNEELLTVNSELQKKNEELTQSNDDMKNLFDGTEIATIFLDNNLNINRFTPHMARIINLIPTDVGRPLVHMAPNLKLAVLLDDVKQVLKTLVTIEKQVETIDDRWYLMRIMPYKTIQNELDGVVVTFVDITTTKEYELKLQQNEADLTAARNFAESIVSMVGLPIIVLNGSLGVLLVNDAYCRLFQTKQEDTIGRSIYELSNEQWRFPDLQKLLDDVLPKDQKIVDYPKIFELPDKRRITMLVNGQQVPHKLKKDRAVVLVLREVDPKSESVMREDHPKAI